MNDSQQAATVLELRNHWNQKRFVPCLSDSGKIVPGSHSFDTHEAAQVVVNAYNKRIKNV